MVTKSMLRRIFISILIFAMTIVMSFRIDTSHVFAMNDSNNTTYPQVGLLGLQNEDLSYEYVCQWGGKCFEPEDGKFIDKNLYGVAVDSDGYVFITDNNNRIQIFSLSGTYLDSLLAANKEAWLQGHHLRGVTVNNGNIYATDGDADNIGIQVFPYDGGVTRWGANGINDGEFYPGLYSVAVNYDCLYIVDQQQNRIQKFSVEGEFKLKWGKEGNGNGQFNNPIGIAVDDDGYVYVVDSGNNRIQKFDAEGQYIKQWGTTGNGDGEFNGPTYIAIDELGNVFVSDTNNNRIEKFDVNGKYLTQWGSLGSEEGEFNMPRGIAVDAACCVYVADALNNRIQKFKPKNHAPIISDVDITGETTAGETLTGSYIFTDSDYDTDESTYQWYRGENIDGTEKESIDGATSKTYDLTNTDIGKYIFFEVTPIDSHGLEGDIQVSQATAQIQACASKGLNNWTQRFENTSYWLNDVAYGKGIFVAVGQEDFQGNKELILTSLDGQEWTKVSEHLYKPLYTITYVDECNAFFATGEEGTVLTSIDGVNWTKMNFANVNNMGNRLYRIAYGNNTLVASSSYVAFYSVYNNGWSWDFNKYKLLENSDLILALAYGNGKFVAMGNNNIYTSSDGVQDWVKFRAFPDTYWSALGITYNGSKFIAVGEKDYESTVFTSVDGTNWNYKTLNISGGLQDITWGANHFVAVGENEQILSSANGETWEVKRSDRPARLSAVAYGKNTFVAIGQSIILQSDPIEIQGENHVPIADAGGPYEVYAGESLTLDGSGSSDPDLGDNIVKYEWDMDGDDIGDVEGVNLTLTWEQLQSFNLSIANPDTGMPKNNIRLKVTDRFGFISTQNTTVTIISPVPKANDDSYTMYKGEVLTVAVPGVLENDIDSDGDVLKAYVVSEPQHGQLSLNEDGSFTYTPTVTYFGRDSFTYRVQDDDGSDTAVVTIIIQVENHAPKPGSGQSFISSPQFETDKKDDGSVTITVNKQEFDKETGETRVKLSSMELEDAFDQAGMDEDGKKKVTLQISEKEEAAGYQVELPKNIIASGDDRIIEIETNIASITLPGNMLDNEESADLSNISLKFKKIEKEELDVFNKIDNDTKQEIGDRPVIEISRMENGEVKPWENENAPVNISIPYIPTQEELDNPENIVVWYIDGQGKAIKVTNGKYNSNTGMVEFNVTHFSTYAIAYTEISFDDLDTYPWAKHAIEVLAAKGITNGTGDNNYSPGEKITRADYLTLLLNTLELNADFQDNFDDVNKSNYYYKAVGIAKELGITGGAGNNKFAPKAYITRQEMMALTERALRKAGKIKEKGDASQLDIFKDKKKIAKYAIEGTAILVKEGLIRGSGEMINPQGNTTRAEAAAIIYRVYNK